MNFRAILFVILSFIILMVSVLMRPAPDLGLPAADQAQVETADDQAADSQLADSGAADADAANNDEAIDDAANNDEATDDKDDLANAERGDDPSSINQADGDQAADDSQEESDPEEQTDGKKKSIAASGGTDAAPSPATAADALEAATEPQDSASLSSNGVTEPLTAEQIETLIEERRPAKTADENAKLNAWCYRAQEMQGELTSIGSLEADSGQRYLITANSVGGTIRRIELNHRKESGRHFYRDLEITYGYIGSLDCYDAKEGCKVGVVGVGTPAEIAGMKKGDIIKTIGEVEVATKFDFETALSNTEPGEDVEVVVKRNGNFKNLGVTLGEKPIELIRPEPSVIDPTRQLIESFSMALKKPSDSVNELWDDLGEDMLHGVWDVRQTNIDGSDAIEFTYTIKPADLEPLEIAGPLRVVKRYILPKFKTTETLDPHTFHWNFELEVFNDSDEDQELGYSLIGPIGTPSETWWYANKIYGGGGLTGIGGARDVSASLPEKGFVYAGNADVIRNVKKKPPVSTYVVSPFDTVNNSEEGRWNWAGIDAQYFNVSMINTEQKSLVTSMIAVSDGATIPKNSREQRLVDISLLSFEKFDVPAGGSVKRSFEIFAGPKEKEILAEYGLDENRAFGWFWWCSKPLLWLLHVFYFLSAGLSYGIAIIILTVLVRCFMIPFSRKAALNAQMMQALQPKMKEIADKYEDLQERGAAQRDLFKKHNYNPLGGCLVMFIQLPVFLGLYRGLSVDIALRDQPLIPGLAWCSDLSAPDKFMYWKDWMPAALGAESGWLGPYLNILPLITMVLFLVQQRLFTPPAVDDQQKMMQKMMGFMMLFMGLMFFKVPSGLCIYFITSSIWGILERKLLPKPVLDTDALNLDEPVSISKAQRKRLNQEKEKVEEKRKRNADRKKDLKKRNGG